MPVKKRRVRSKRPRQGKENNAVVPTAASPETQGREKRWLTHLFDLLKIGVGLANLVLGLLKH